MNSEKLKLLIRQPEGLKIDFKRKFYKISSEDYTSVTNQQQVKNLIKKQWGEFIKDILSLANGNVNTVSQEGFLIIGVDDKTKSLHDIGAIDTAAIRQQLITKLEDHCKPAIPDITCELIKVEEKRILIFVIPPSPHLYETTRDIATKDTVYHKNTVFIRRGEGIGPADQAERNAILSEKQHQNHHAKHQFLAQSTKSAWKFLLSIGGKKWRLEFVVFSGLVAVVASIAGSTIPGLLDFHPKPIPTIITPISYNTPNPEGTSQNGTESANRVGVLIVSKDNAIEWKLTEQIESILREKGQVVSEASSFVYSSVLPEKFDQFFAGMSDERQYSQFFKKAYLGRKALAFEETPELENIFTATVRLEIHVISADPKDRMPDMMFTAKGVGFSQNDAERTAIERLLNELKKKL